MKLVSRIPVEISLDCYSVTNLELNAEDEILSAIVVFGFLSYHDGLLRSPNYELMERFNRVLTRPIYKL